MASARKNSSISEILFLWFLAPLMAYGAFYFQMRSGHSLAQVATLIAVLCELAVLYSLGIAIHRLFSTNQNIGARIGYGVIAFWLALLAAFPFVMLVAIGRMH